MVGLRWGFGIAWPFLELQEPQDVWADGGAKHLTEPGGKLGNNPRLTRVGVQHPSLVLAERGRQERKKG